MSKTVPASATSSGANSSSFSIVDAVNDVLAGVDHATFDKYAQEMTAAYRTLWNRSEQDAGIVFISKENRQAYVKQYVRAHAVLMHEALSSHEDLLAFLQSVDHLIIHSVGGGPGSDVLGVLNFFKVKGLEVPPIMAYIMDVEKRWMNTWAEVWGSFCQKKDIRVSSNYITFDVTQPTDVADCPEYFKNAKLVTMVKFASAVAHAPNGPDAFYKAFFAAIPAGCFVIVVDNWSPKPDDMFTRAARNAAKEADMEELVHDRCLSVDQSLYPEEMSALSQQQGTAQFRAYLPNKMYLIVWRKKAVQEVIEGIEELKVTKKEKK